MFYYYLIMTGFGEKCALTRRQVQMHCPSCAHSFPLLDDEAGQCSKCRARKPGMSVLELEVINVRIQLIYARTQPTINHNA